NFAQVVDDGPAERLVRDPAADAGTARRRPVEVVVVQLPRSRALDFVQYLNQEGQEAGMVPVDATVCRTRRQRDGQSEEDHGYARVARQVMASSPTPAQASARALTAQLEQLQRNVRR